MLQRLVRSNFKSI